MAENSPTSAGEAAPHHVAIIMDGNGRWAAQRGLPRSEGHRLGVEALRRTVRAAGELGIQIITIYSFSMENWTRPNRRSLISWVCCGGSSGTTLLNCTATMFAFASS